MEIDIVLHSDYEFTFCCYGEIRLMYTWHLKELSRLTAFVLRCRTYQYYAVCDLKYLRTY